MTNADEIKKKVRSQILEITYVDESEIKNDTKIFERGLVDSMGFSIIISFLEDTFAANIKDKDLVNENFESIDAIAKFIINKKNKNSN